MYRRQEPCDYTIVQTCLWTRCFLVTFNNIFVAVPANHPAMHREMHREFSRDTPGLYATSPHVVGLVLVLIMVHSIVELVRRARSGSMVCNGQLVMVKTWLVACLSTDIRLARYLSTDIRLARYLCTDI